MKNIKLLFFNLLLVVSFTSCSKNTSPEITYLYVSKSADVTFSESVIVRATVNDEDNDPITYAWSCSGGEITGSGKEVSWKAPSQVGTYTVTIVASDGESEKTMSKDILVAGSYCFNFGQASPVWSYDQNTTRVFSGGYMTLFSNDPSNVNYAVYGYNAETDIPIPFALKTRIAINSNDVLPASNPRLQLNIFMPVQDNVDKYLKSIMLYVYPASNTWKVRTAIFDTLTSTNSYQDIDVDASSNSKAIFTENSQYHTIGMAITIDKKFVLSLDGEELYSSYALANNSLFIRDLKLSAFSYSVAPGLKMYVDDFYLTTDGTVLK